MTFRPSTPCGGFTKNDPRIVQSKGTVGNDLSCPLPVSCLKTATIPAHVPNNNFTEGKGCFSPCTQSSQSVELYMAYPGVKFGK